MQKHCWEDKAKTNKTARTYDDNGTQQNPDSFPTLDTTQQEKKRQTKDNMEEDNCIRAGGNGFFYGPSSVRCKGQKKTVTNC